MCLSRVQHAQQDQKDLDSIFTVCKCSPTALIVISDCYSGWNNLQATCINISFPETGGEHHQFCEGWAEKIPEDSEPRWLSGIGEWESRWWRCGGEEEQQRIIFENHTLFLEKNEREGAGRPSPEQYEYFSNVDVMSLTYCLVQGIGFEPVVVTILTFLSLALILLEMFNFPTWRAALRFSSVDVKVPKALVSQNGKWSFLLWKSKEGDSWWLHGSWESTGCLTGPIFYYLPHRIHIFQVSAPKWQSDSAKPPVHDRHSGFLAFSLCNSFSLSNPATFSAQYWFLRWVMVCFVRHFCSNKHLL